MYLSNGCTYSTCTTIDRNKADQVQGQVTCEICKGHGVHVCRLYPFCTDQQVDDNDPIGTNLYLIQQLDKLGISYIHVIEPRVAYNYDIEVSHKSKTNEHFRKAWSRTFISAGKGVSGHGHYRLFLAMAIESAGV